MREPHGENKDLPVITAFMKELAAEPFGGSPAKATFVWWKAQLARRWDAEHRAAAPVTLDECIRAGLGALAGTGLVVWRWATSPPLAAAVAAIASISGVLILLTSAMFVAGGVIVNRPSRGKWPC